MNMENSAGIVRDECPVSGCKAYHEPLLKVLLIAAPGFLIASVLLLSLCVFGNTRDDILLPAGLSCIIITNALNLVRNRILEALSRTGGGTTNGYQGTRP